MTNILLLAYHFPPALNGAVARTGSLHRYLPEFGHPVSVITTSCFGRLADEPRVYRFDALQNWRRSDNRLRKFAHAVVRTTARHAGFEEWRDLYWQRRVEAELDRIVAQDRIGAIYASFPPFDPLRLGVRLKQRTGLPLFVEIRDGLVYDPIHKLSAPRRRRLQKLEAGVVAASDAVITIGDRLSGYFQNQYPRARVFTVRNGFDPADFDGLAGLEREPDGVLRFFHFGSMDRSRQRDSAPLFQAIARLKADGDIAPGGCEFRFIGNYTERELSAAARHGIADIVTFHPPVAKADGFAEILRTGDYLLLFGIEGADTIIPSKLYEYLRLGKPVVGICAGNEAERIIRETAVGEIADFSPPAVHALLKKAVRRDIAFTPVPERIADFSRKTQAQRIAELITDTIDARAFADARADQD